MKWFAVVFCFLVAAQAIVTESMARNQPTTYWSFGEGDRKNPTVNPPTAAPEPDCVSSVSLHLVIEIVQKLKTFVSGINEMIVPLEQRIFVFVNYVRDLARFVREVSVKISDSSSDLVQFENMVKDVIGEANRKPCCPEITTTPPVQTVTQAPQTVTLPPQTVTVPPQTVTVPPQTASVPHKW